MKAVASRNSYSAWLASLFRVMLLLALASCGGGGSEISDVGVAGQGSAVTQSALPTAVPLAATYDNQLAASTIGTTSEGTIIGSGSTVNQAAAKK